MFPFTPLPRTEYICIHIRGGMEYICIYRRGGRNIYMYYIRGGGTETGKRGHTYGHTSEHAALYI